MPKVHPFVKTDMNDAMAFGIPICEKTLDEIWLSRKLKENLRDFDSDLHFKASVVTILKQYHGVISEIVKVIEKMNG